MHLALIAIHTNFNAATKRAQDVHQEEQKSGDDRSEYSEEEAGGEAQFEGEEGNVGPKKQRTSRPWYDTTADEIGVFIGILLLQGEAKLGSTTNYWNCQTDRGCVLAIHSAMSQVRWHQIKRYLKISNLATDLDSTGRDWYTKVELLYSDFVTASMSNFKLDKNVSVDEQLILFKRRSRHSMQIGTKAAGVGFKIYSLCSENYL